MEEHPEHFAQVNFLNQDDFQVVQDKYQTCDVEKTKSRKPAAVKMMRLFFHNY